MRVIICRELNAYTQYTVNYYVHCKSFITHFDIMEYILYVDPIAAV